MREIIKLGSLSLVTAMVLVGCGSSSDNSNQNDEVLETKIGYFLDSAVVGADYITSSELNGTTDRFGRFKYKDGDKVKLYIGKLLLGEVEPTDEGLITPKTLASQSENSQRAESLILRVLQSLDSDSNVTNGITLDRATRESFSSIDKEVDILALESEESLTDIPEIGIKVDRDNDGIIDVNATDAQTHFDSSIQSWNDGNRPDDNIDTNEHENNTIDNQLENNQTNGHRNSSENDNGKDDDAVIPNNNNMNNQSDNNETNGHGNSSENENGKDDDTVIPNNNDMNNQSDNNQTNGHENSSENENGKDDDAVIPNNNDMNNQSDNNQTNGHGNSSENENGKDDDAVIPNNNDMNNQSDNNQTNGHGNSSEENGNGNSEEGHSDGLNLDDYAKSTLTTEQKYALAYMWNEEKLAYDVYSELNKVQPQKQLENIATRSEIKHIQMVEDLVQRYDINITNLDTYEIKYSESELRALPTGTFAVDSIQNLYNKLYDKGIKSGQDALEVGCMVEVTDINDLNIHIATAQANNATDIIDTFDKLRSGSYNHYWSFDKGLKNMGVTDGCCSLGTIDGVEYCHLDYPQNENGNESSAEDNAQSSDNGQKDENTQSSDNGQKDENAQSSDNGQKDENAQSSDNGQGNGNRNGQGSGNGNGGKNSNN